MKYLLISIIICMTLSCEDKDNSLDSKEYIWPELLSEFDTISNKDFYKARLYFKNDSLIEIAKKKKIENPISFRYEVNVDGNKIFIPMRKDYSKINGDTVYVSFEVNVDNLKIDQIKEYFWHYLGINFKSNSSSPDTAFSESVRILVKGSSTSSDPSRIEQNPLALLQSVPI